MRFVTPKKASWFQDIRANFFSLKDAPVSICHHMLILRRGYWRGLLHFSGVVLNPKLSNPLCTRSKLEFLCLITWYGSIDVMNPNIRCVLSDQFWRNIYFTLENWFHALFVLLKFFTLTVRVILTFSRHS